MAKPRMKTTEQTEVSEAQIAVHWKEEAYYQPSEKFKAQEHARPARVRPVRARQVPRLLQRVCGHADLVRALSHRPRYQRRAVLEMVRRRQDQRLVQLRGSPTRQVSKQSSLYFRARARSGAGRGHDVSGTL